jgi:hypothetical protein
MGSARAARHPAALHLAWCRLLLPRSVPPPLQPLGTPPLLQAQLWGQQEYLNEVWQASTDTMAKWKLGGLVSHIAWSQTPPPLAAAAPAAPAPAAAAAAAAAAPLPPRGAARGEAGSLRPVPEPVSSPAYAPRSPLAATPLAATPLPTPPTSPYHDHANSGGLHLLRLLSTSTTTNGRDR